MKFAAAFVTLVTSSLALAAPSLTVDCIVATKHQGLLPGSGFHQDCLPLAFDCEDFSKNSTDLWSHPSCIAAATCEGTLNVHDLTKGCQNPNVTSLATLPHLNYNVYASIVGDCAWAKNGCPITQQNFIDFYYSTLSKVGSDSWPMSVQDVIDNYWKPILAWTNTGNTIPYTNFDDWLHYSQWSS